MKKNWVMRPWVYPGLSLSQDAQRRSGFFGDKAYWRNVAYSQLVELERDEGEASLDARERRMLKHLRLYAAKHLGGLSPEAQRSYLGFDERLQSLLLDK